MKGLESSATFVYRVCCFTSSFEAWYQKQTHYVKISERSNENGIYREA